MKTETVFADANLFLRYLTDDIPEQADRVEALLRRAAGGEARLVTTALVIAEIVWTLESHYRLPRADIQDKALAILGTPGLVVEDSDLLLQGISWYAAKNVDFIDAFNAAWMLKHGVKRAATFDQTHFRRFEGIEAEEPA
ncbi:MAG: type II toxin-antitoxin system VapC family toxin [Chloroflexi bacterium]|nr:type II toxin-antitoxin system VapC family toxin [Chloroflexota bacterium]